MYLCPVLARLFARSAMFARATFPSRSSSWHAASGNNGSGADAEQTKSEGGINLSGTNLTFEMQNKLVQEWWGTCKQEYNPRMTKHAYGSEVLSRSHVIGAMPHIERVPGIPGVRAPSRQQHMEQHRGRQPAPSVCWSAQPPAPEVRGWLREPLPPTPPTVDMLPATTTPAKMSQRGSRTPPCVTPSSLSMHIGWRPRDAMAQKPLKDSYRWPDVRAPGLRGSQELLQFRAITEGPGNPTVGHSKLPAGYKLSPRSASPWVGRSECGWWHSS